ncbi:MULTISPECIES: adenylyl-sulfate kinase [unclassified Paenibacillus]|uniref:adenylyl-sulfate kinase n=1 Tax=unclassified Paenibacillus TaxID=185978 RepID=UPI002782DF40|nr:MULTISPECIES: adenylyl-sulfate kinase [unclassified Paenibacillus]MDQ0901563.1 adenylylsulfate kinase [Paenibacillus sp. V4I7]MDQ0919935.1 adenylylsulfate kinase [Paenibacillus sp. V4I5]
MTSNPNVVYQPTHFKMGDRHSLNGHKSCVLWFTGLSGSGKSTLAVEVEKELFRLRLHSYILDGDNIRMGLNRDLGFGPSDRTENIRRIGEVSKLFVDAGVIVLSAFISPYQADRDLVRALFQPGEFIEIYVDCPIVECERRDPKGLYRKARQGEITNFTGVSAPYEIPSQPEITLRTDHQTVSECVEAVITYLIHNKIF